MSVHLHINKDVKPIVSPTRRIPFAIREKVEAELERLQRLDIIEPAKGATPWVSPIVAFPKPNNPEKIRLCVDMRLPNQAIERERHPQPTIDDLITDLNGARYFSKLDLNSAYHQLELDESSRYITTFTTHKGLFQYKRLNFGTSSASEIFQNTMQNVLSGIPGCRNISDDIIIFGGTKEEHDTTLRKVFEVTKQRNLRFTFDKCQFDQHELEFFGYIFSDRGISPSPVKVQAVKACAVPTNASEVRSFLGMIQYCSRFIPNLATISAPLRLLTRKDVPWEWTDKEQAAFDELKKLLTTNTVMGYFDPLKQTELYVDASPVGLGAILSQTTPGDNDRTILAYASRSLTDVETRYSQIEREALGIVYGVEHFRLYLFGREFTLITDHKPLELIYQNPKSHSSARLERLCLRLRDYQFTVRYRPGPENPADYLSRHPLPSDSTDTFVEEYVNFVGSSAIPVAMDIDEIRNATRSDPTLQQLIEIIQTNNWNILTHPETLGPDIDIEELHRFRKVRGEISISSEADLILRGTRVIMPKILRQRAVDLAHEGHQGLVKTKKLIREKVWFPQIDSLVESCVQKCLACQSVGQPNKPAPLETVEIPQHAWDTVYMDFLGPFPNGDLLLVVIDGRTRYPEVEIVLSTAATPTISCLERVFATHGLPNKAISDNGPPFTSYKVRNFMAENKINHHKITPLWPQGNAEAENFMKPLKKCIQAAYMENKSWRTELYKFLLNYRATPHSTTKIAPATALFGRTIRSKLPGLPATVENMDEINKKIDQEDKIAKQNRKLYADRRRVTKQPTFKIGSQVLVMQPKINKLTPRFNPNPYKVTAVNGTMITAARSNHSITRNCSHFKMYTGQSDCSSDDDMDFEPIALHQDGREEERNEHHDQIVERQYPARRRERPIYYHEEQ